MTLLSAICRSIDVAVEVLAYAAIVVAIAAVLALSGCSIIQSPAKSEITPANVSIKQHEQRPVTIEETTTTTTIRRPQ